MTSLASLWLPILVSAVVVFIASSVIHMALPWHHAAVRCSVSEGVPDHRTRGLRRLRAGAVADVDLVPPLLGHDDQDHHRRVDLRGADGRCFRLAVAPGVIDGAAAAISC